MIRRFSAALLAAHAWATATSTGAFFQSKSVIIPHDDKKHRGGEDSADSSDQVLAVADGVGGWVHMGINPGLFSMTLTQSIVDLVKAKPKIGPSDLVYGGCMEAAKKYEGSATAVAVKIVNDHTIEAVNLGDSGYALFHVRPDNTLDMYFKSKSQQKTHNFPSQCGRQSDDPRTADVYHHDDVQDGDVLLLFTDGFSDNVYESGFPYCIEEEL